MFFLSILKLTTPRDKSGYYNRRLTPLLLPPQGPTDYPCCVGHEIIGTAVRVGTQIPDMTIRVGDRVGVGAQADSCQGRKEGGDCEACASGMENYCPVRHIPTYNGRHWNGDKTYGGYATYHRSPARFVVKIPDAISSAHAASMMCAGVTTYSPLKFHGAGPGKSVGIIGLGGLGHFGVMWAKALGADRVVVISRTGGKREDAVRMGADGFIATDEEEGWERKHASSLDLIVCTVSSTSMPLMKYLSLLRLDGTFVQVGAPDDGLPPIQQSPLIFKRLKITGSLIGSPKEIREMLELAVEKDVRPWIEEIPMRDANRAIVEMEKGTPRYRYILVNEDDVGEAPIKAGL